MLTPVIERGCFDQRLARFARPGEKRLSSTRMGHVRAIDEIVRQWREAVANRAIDIFRLDRDAFLFAARNPAEVAPRLENEFRG